MVVAGFCAPSYLWLEPPATSEEVGWGCLAAAAFGAVVSAAALIGAVRALWSLRQWRGNAREVSIGGGYGPIFIVGGSAPFLALAGVVRPRLVATRCVMDTLTSEELLAAIRHERAHQASRDNLKRLLLLLAPDLLPAWPGLLAIEHAWARFAEWAADDRAAAGDPHYSVSLAAALVRFARMGNAPVSSPLVTSLLADTCDLSQRVDRLLECRPRPDAGGWFAVAWPFCTSLAVIGVAYLIRQPAALYWVHETLERLVH